MVNLAVQIGALKLKNPVMVASGTFGEEYKELIDINSLGAYVTKTITTEPRLGNPAPRIAETPSGMLNAIGLENKGLADFMKHKMPFLATIKIPLIVSIAGDDENEFKELANDLSNVEHIDALELNLSCPNLVRRSAGSSAKNHGIIAQDEGASHKVVRLVKKATKLPIMVKLSPNVTDITKIAHAVEDAGADALVVANTFLGMAIDITAKKPLLGNVMGGLSGPAIKPLTLRMVWEVYQKVKIPIVGVGGIMDYKDALEFILCGARAVQVGTANFVDPKISLEIIQGIKGYMEKNSIRSIDGLVGSAQE